MHKILNLKLHDYDLVNFINLSISFMPFLYILGAPWMETPVILGSVYLIGFYIINFKNKRKNIIIHKQDSILIISFLVVILISSILSGQNLSILKSLAYIRFYLFYIFIINFYDEKYLKKLIFFSVIALSFVIFDVIFQYVFDKDIFGYPPGLEGTRYQGPFGDELISGSFFKYFLFISLGSHYFNNSKLKFIFLFLSFIVIFLSGEKSNIIMITLGLLVLFCLDFKKNYKILIGLISTIFIIFTLIFGILEFENKKIEDKILKLKNRYYVHMLNSIGYNITDDKGEKLSNSIKNSPHVIHFINAYELFQQNIIFGVGIKNYRNSCQNTNENKISNFYKIDKDQFLKYRCTTHPHNIYLELLAEIGLLGTIIFLLIVLKIYFRFIKIFVYENKKVLENFFLSFFIITFPISTTGSFFTNKNSIIFWMILSILLMLNKKFKGN